MSAPLVVNTRDGVCWTRRAVTSGGMALYAPESVKSCPEFVMATIDELAEQGIVGSADVLPVPPGPQWPVFPPAPQPYEEKLEREVARLQGLLGEKTTEVHRARRERGLMRERVSEPFGCAHCGEAKRVHGRRYISGVGVHGWERPSDEQVRERMLARRAARMPMPSVPELDKAHDDLMGANLSLFEEEQENARLRLALESARRGRRELRARVAELEAAAQQIVHLHKDSPMGPCPVCIDADAMVRGDDYTLPYPCPTARLAGAKDCDPPSYRTADFFQPGHAYTHRPGPDSPGGPRLRFYCESVTTDKATGQPVARGWGGRRYGDRWTSVQRAHGLEDWQSGAWADTTTGGDA